MRLRLARSISPAEMVLRVDLPWSTTDASPGVKSGGGDGMSTDSSSVKYGSRPCLSHASIGNAARATSTARPTATKQICRIVTVAVPIAVLAPQEDSSPRQMVQGYAVAAWALGVLRSPMGDVAWLATVVVPARPNPSGRAITASGIASAKPCWYAAGVRRAAAWLPGGDPERVGPSWWRATRAGARGQCDRYTIRWD